MVAEPKSKATVGNTMSTFSASEMVKASRKAFRFMREYPIHGTLK